CLFHGAERQPGHRVAVLDAEFVDDEPPAAPGRGPGPGVAAAVRRLLRAHCRLLAARRRLGLHRVRHLLKWLSSRRRMTVRISEMTASTSSPTKTSVMLKLLADCEIRKPMPSDEEMNSPTTTPTSAPAMPMRMPDRMDGTDAGSRIVSHSCRSLAR